MEEKCKDLEQAGQKTPKEFLEHKEKLSEMEGQCEALREMYEAIRQEETSERSMLFLSKTKIPSYSL